MADPTTLPFDWVDPFALDEQLTDEERMVRDTAEDYAQEKLQPRVTERLSRREVRPRDHARNGRARPARRDHPARIWRRRPQLCQLRPDRARRRAGRQRLSLGDVGPVAPRDASDQRLRLRGAAPEISAEAGQRRMGRLLRPDRARRRLRSRQHAHPRRRRSTAATGCPAPRCGSPIRRSPTSSSSGRSRTRMAADPGLRARKGNEGPVARPRSTEKLSLARLDHRRDRDGRGRGAGGESAAQRQRPRRARSAASTAPATASPGARWAPPRPATMPPAATRSSASSSAGRSPPPSSSS